MGQPLIVLLLRRCTIVIMNINKKSVISLMKRHQGENFERQRSKYEYDAV